MQKNPQIYPISRERAILEKIRRSASLRGFVVSPGHLREDVKIDNNKTNYAFNLVSSNRNTERPERKLNDKNVFVATKMGLLLAQKVVAKPGTEILQSYPNPQVFGGTAQTAAELESFYSGELEARIDNTIVYDGLPTSLFRYVPETIKSASITHSNYAGVPGLIDLEPMLVLNGQREMKFSVEVPGFTTGTPAWQTTDAGVEATLVLYLTGFLINSAAEGHYEHVVNALRA